MNKRRLSSDPLSGTTTWHEWDESSQSSLITTTQDVTSIVEANKALYNDTDERQGYGGDGLHKVASIPLSVLADLRARGIAQDQKKMKAWINDPANRFFRTRPGRV